MERDLESSSNFHRHDSSKLRLEEGMHETNIKSRNIYQRQIRGWWTNLVEVSVGQDGELLLDGLQESDGDVEAVIGAVGELRWEPHGPERPAGLRHDIVRPRWVPPGTNPPVAAVRHQTT